MDETEEVRFMAGSRTLAVIGGGIESWTCLFRERDRSDLGAAEYAGKRDSFVEDTERSREYGVSEYGRGSRSSRAWDEGDEEKLFELPREASDCRRKKCLQSS